MHGEAEDTDEAGIELCRELRPQILAKFQIKDIYNLDETGIFYHQLPTRHLMCKKRKGKKLSKMRCTVNAIAHTPGNYIHLQLIGQSKMPRDFGIVVRPFDHFGIKY